MKLKQLAVAVASIAAIGFSAQASAAPTFSLANGYNGAVKIKLSNWESFTGDGVTPGSENFGLIHITDMRSDNGTNQLVWSEATGTELWGVFNGITVQSATPSGSGMNLQSTGGRLDIYLNTLGSAAAVGAASQGMAGYGAGGCAVAGLCYNGISNAGGVLFLSLEWVPGIKPGITVDGNFDSSTVITTGDAAGFLKVVGGAYASNFDQNGFLGGAADMFGQNDFFPNNGTDAPIQGDWQLLSEDPVRAKYVPEPGTIALLGAALAGFGLFGRRRKVA